MKTIDTLDISPFKRLVMTIGELPTSFIESMSYYEALAWLVNYIEKTVVPTVNNNAEATQELQDAFIQLKDYVDNYFENLDVQEEINNKLDEMAESGELVEIIAQYLRLAGILVYNTVADLSAATNLTNGSVAKTLGITDYKNGDGSFYKIRPITSEDVVDGLNIVAITEDNTLIAERIPDHYINELFQKMGDLNDLHTENKNTLVDAINSALDAITENNEEDINTKNFIDETIAYPLLLGKKSDGTNTASAQGIAVKFNETTGLPEKIFQWYDYTSYAKLYVTTCGSRSEGTGWSTTVLNSANNEIPYSHGSTITYNPKTDRIYCGMAAGIVGVINYTSKTYTTIDLTSLGLTSTIIGISFDRITETWNVCTNNLYHYILNEDLNEIIREYSYTANDYPDYSSYGFQGYDYYNGLEYRCMSSNYNMLMIFNTYTGKLIKTISPNGVYGEIEGIAVNENVALLHYNTADDYCGLIYHNYVCECYLGGFPSTNIKMLQDYHVIGSELTKVSIIPQTNIANSKFTIYYANNYSDNEIIRYVGMGTQANPIKSGSAMGTFISILCGIANTGASYNIQVNTSSNHDDNGFMFNEYPNLSAVIQFNTDTTPSVSYLDIRKCHYIEVWNARINNTGTTRRTNGLLTIRQNNNVNTHGTLTCQNYNIELNTGMIVYDTGIDALSGSAASYFRRNVTMMSSANVTSKITNSGGGTLSKIDNVTVD